jgi:SAM-dependent methyltransferase
MNDKKKQTKDTYNESASLFAANFENVGSRKDDIDKAFSYINKQNPFVFELGCGNGRDAKEILKLTNNYLGIDISEELVKLAQEKVPQAKFEVGDFEAYSYPDNADIIFAFASLLHADKESLRSILKKAYESLGPNGVFFISLKHGEYSEKRQEDKYGVRYFYYYTPELIKEFARDSFKCVWEELYELKGYPWTKIILQKTLPT